ncbi:MAG: acyl-CoA dehydrogenase, partial [Steroidobacteraceae bacterium]
MSRRADHRDPALHPATPLEPGAPLAYDRWARLRGLIEAPLPLPGQGHTLDRWRMLASVAAEDLSLAKVYESHADALAILRELGADGQAGVWAVFAADPPGALLRARRGAGGLSGQKAWCSAAAHIDAALVTCIDEAGERRLARVDFQQPGLVLQPSSWAAAGMADTETLTVVFENVAYEFVGVARSYLDRPGFWQGAIGVAACWFGAAAAIARTFRQRCEQRADA